MTITVWLHLHFYDFVCYILIPHVQEIHSDNPWVQTYRLGILQYLSSVHSLACPPILFGCCLNYQGSIICQSLFSFSPFVYSLWCATRFVLTQNKLWNVGIEQGNIIVHPSGLWLSSAGWTLRIFRSGSATPASKT